MNQTKSDLSISINIKKIILFLSLFAGFLIFADLSGEAFKFVTGHDYVYGILPQFNLDAENNIPTCFSTLILFFSSVLLWFIAENEKQLKGTYARHWKGLSFVFLFLAFDETASFHEMLARPVLEILHASKTLYYVWVIPEILLVFALGIIYLRFLIALPKQILMIFIIAGMLYVCGAAGMEIAGYYLKKIYPSQNLIYSFFVVIEEGLEMFSVIVFIKGLLEYMNLRILGSILVSICH